MADDLVLYSHPMSRGRIARWMLEEVGQPYRVEMLDYGTTMKAPEFLAINPMGKVPALRHGDVVVTEGAAICAYLADTFPEGRAGAPGQRARCLLPLAVFRCRTARDSRYQRGAEGRGAAGAPRHDWVWVDGRRARRGRADPERERAYRRQSLHGRRRRRRFADRLGHDVRDDRQASGVRDLLETPRRPSPPPCAHEPSTTRCFRPTSGWDCSAR